jgi:hypothetical protein
LCVLSDDAPHSTPSCLAVLEENFLGIPRSGMPLIAAIGVLVLVRALVSHQSCVSAHCRGLPANLCRVLRHAAVCCDAALVDGEGRPSAGAVAGRRRGWQGEGDMTDASPQGAGAVSSIQHKERASVQWRSS